jgi:hypothetical protein
MDFGVPMKLVRMIKMFLNEYIFCIFEYLSDKFPIQNGLMQGGASLPVLFNSALQYDIRKSRRTKWD